MNEAIGGGMEATLCAALTGLDIARGLKLLHKYQIVHGDLKPCNILIAATAAAKARAAGLGALALRVAPRLPPRR